MNACLLDDNPEVSLHSYNQASFLQVQVVYIYSMTCLRACEHPNNIFPATEPGT